MNATADTVTSANGTRIAVERTGGGDPVILIGGAFSDRSTVAGPAAVLADSFTGPSWERFAAVALCALRTSYGSVPRCGPTVLAKL
jgi:hypothetical protein